MTVYSHLPLIWLWRHPTVSTFHPIDLHGDWLPCFVLALGLCQHNLRSVPPVQVCHRAHTGACNSNHQAHACWLQANCLKLFCFLNDVQEAPAPAMSSGEAVKTLHPLCRKRESKGLPVSECSVHFGLEWLLLRHSYQSKAVVDVYVCAIG